MSTSYALQLLRGFSGSSSKEPGTNPNRKSERDMSTLGRWLRELRPGARAEPPPPQRHHPAYHSERRRRHKPSPGNDHRRHSFNDHPRQRCYSNGCEVRARGSSMASPAPAPPVRDASSLRARAPGAGHEKFPSWPAAPGADTPPALRAPPTGGSSRSKSWTDHTEYPKEQPLTYTRPFMKRHHHSNSYNKQLKTVMERCEKLAPEVFESRRYSGHGLPYVDREGKSLGDLDYAVPSPPERDTPPLTQADLEAYLQPSYAQSEGYHSYVSSADSSSTATPFLDRLRRDSEAKAGGGRDSVVTTSSGSASASSSETLKWHGSLGDVSAHSHAQQLIAHSARVQTPQRHHSESVLYMDRKLYPLSTYTVLQPHQHPQPPPQQQRYTYLDPEKKHRVSDPTLKAIQKKALLSFYERHHGPWRSEPQLAEPQAPPPPPRAPPSPSRRASSASDYAGSLRRGPVIVGPAICVDDWVPERPPKNPALRHRAPTPPPPSPPPTPEPGAYASDEPLPPPPPAADLALPPAPARSWQRQSFLRAKPLPPVPLQPPPPLHPRQSLRAAAHHMSASKASYLAARREREMGVCGPDSGSYKRTMSPGGDPCSRLQPAVNINTTITTTTSLVRRASTVEPAKQQAPPPLPDVLPQRDTPPPRLMTPPASPSPTPSPSPAPSPQPLQLIQRTEVTLRVNATTSDAGCQTEQDKDIQVDEVDIKIALPTRKKLQEEIDCERLQQDLAQHLASSDRLKLILGKRNIYSNNNKVILVAGPEHRKPTDYISASGLFKVEVTSRSRVTSSNNNTPPASPTAPPGELSTSSAYFTTSEPKAKFLTSLASRDFSCVTRDSTELERKKEELVSRLARKLQVLRSEADAVAEERRVNDELGAEVARRVSRSARPHEAAKFRLHVDEVGQITALLLSLSGRLARAENALMSLDESPGTCDLNERKSLEDKRDKLASQLTEAKQLKESIDKRSGHVSNMLVQYLSGDEYADYDHFINMKAKLIMDARDISDKIKLGEEQLQALKDTLADV